MSETTEASAPQGDATDTFDPTAGAQAEQPDNTEETGTSEETADDTGAEEQQARPRGGFQKRISELTLARRQADAEAAYWREQAMRAQQAQPAQPPGETPLPPDLAQWVGNAPDPNDSRFKAGEFDPAYIEERTLHRIKVEQAKSAMAQRHMQMRVAASAVEQRAAAIVQEVGASDPALVDVITAPDFKFSPAMRATLIELDAPAQVLAFLGRNPAEAAKIAQMPPAKAAAAMGRLEARLTAAPPATQAVSTAPPPPRTIRGAASNQPRTPAEARSMEEYARLRGEG